MPFTKTYSRRVGLWAALVLCSLVAWSACKSSPRPQPGAGAEVPEVDETRFPHALHTGDRPEIRGYQGRGLVCTDCHARDSVTRGEPARPGAREHAPCDDCHRQEFYQPPGPFCQNCHTRVDIVGAAPAVEMQPYPERGFRKILASTFSHRTHLDGALMDTRMGFHVACVDCHPRDAMSRDPELPGHAQCVRCHRGGDADAAADASGPMAMAECGACHRQRDVELVRGRVFITGDLRFAHADHERDRRGQDIGCTECHADIPASRRAADASVPTMRACATCHEDASKTPDRVRIAECGVCHGVVRSGEVPPDHLAWGPSSQVPEDHTIEFRKRHGAEASSPEAKCSYCHEGLTRSNRDNCHQCHSIMRPRDHVLGWYDGHGQEAVSDRDRCATCHTGDECVACHQVTPRSHTPLGAFRLGGHATAARMNTRSCFACHTFEDTCSSCHRGMR